MARRLVTTTDATLVGDAEFALRDQATGTVAGAYAEHTPKRVYHHRYRLPRCQRSARATGYRDKPAAQSDEAAVEGGGRIIEFARRQPVLVRPER